MSVETSHLVLQAAIADLDLVEQPVLKTQSNESASPSASAALYVAFGKTEDITSSFTSAASVISTGSLIKDEFFTLFEAVGALEIMDPKMDSGFLAPGETLSDSYDVLRTLLPAEALGIMDSMLCSEVAWHTGHPLSQTLFTSLYLDHLLWPESSTLEQASFYSSTSQSQDNPMLHIVLRTFCLLLIKASDFVHKTISREGYYEEEDFVTNLYHRSLLSNLPSSGIIQLANEAIEHVNNLHSISSTIRHALVTRLKFRQAFLEATAVEPDQYSEQGTDAWARCLSTIGQISETHKLGLPVPESFSVKVQRRLTSSVPPRPIVHVDFDTALEFHAQLCKDGIKAANALLCPTGSNLITFLRVFFSHKPPSALYIRCLLQSLIFNHTRKGDKNTEREFIFRELSDFVLPGHLLLDRHNAEIEIPTDDRYKIWERMSRCCTQLFDAFHDLLRALCMNRSRTRRMLCHIIQDWDNLQLDLEDLDNELRNFTNEKSVIADSEAWELPLSSWAYFYKLRQMEWAVQLGFELNIYHVDEWPGMFQYLQNMASTRHRHINRIFGFVHLRREECSRLLSTRPLDEFDRCISVLEFVSEEAAGIANLAQALACLYQALSLLSLLPKWPNRPYSNDQFRRAIRLRPFLQICIPQLDSISGPFEDIEKICDSVAASELTLAKRRGPKLSETTQKAMALLAIADSRSRAARRSLDLVSKSDADIAMCVGCEEEWRRGMKQIIRAAVTVGVIGAKVTKWALDGCSVDALRLNFVQDESREASSTMAACWRVPTIDDV